jgi:uroporphyrinogen III methyltransferase/synthase
MRKNKKGKVYIIGAGPGDAGLITLKGIDCLRAADVVIYDYLVSKDLLKYARSEARLIYAGKQGSAHTLSQWKINDLLVKDRKHSRASQGRRSFYFRPRRGRSGKTRRKRRSF